MLVVSHICRLAIALDVWSPVAKRKQYPWNLILKNTATVLGMLPKRIRNSATKITSQRETTSYTPSSLPSVIYLADGFDVQDNTPRFLD